MTVEIIFFFIMYFGLQDTIPPPCPLHLTERGGSIHCSKLYFYALYKLVLYILTTITIYCIIASTRTDHEYIYRNHTGFFFCVACCREKNAEIRPCQYSDHLCKGADGVYICYSYSKLRLFSKTLKDSPFL